MQGGNNQGGGYGGYNSQQNNSAQNYGALNQGYSSFTNAAANNNPYGYLQPPPLTGYLQPPPQAPNPAASSSPSTSPPAFDLSQINQTAGLPTGGQSVPQPQIPQPAPTPQAAPPTPAAGPLSFNDWMKNNNIAWANKSSSSQYNQYLKKLPAV